MTHPVSPRSGSDILPSESGALSVPPPVPQKKPGFFRRLFTSRKKQQAVAMQNGYAEMVDLIRAIRNHLDLQETVQTRVLTMLEKVPDAMERQHEVMTIFKQQLENGMENNRRLTDSMGNLNNTLASMDESQKASSRTITDLIHRSRESELLLREVMRRAERRMTILLVVFTLLVIGLGFYFVRWQNHARNARAAAAAPVSVVAPAMVAEKAVEPVVATEPVKEKKAKRKSRAHAAPQPAVTVEPVAGAPAAAPASVPPADQPVAAP